ncbi:MAG: hypothetical protein ACKVHE_00595 [Planctomycetales bacterium]|jgi:hypothetical protein
MPTRPKKRKKKSEKTSISKESVLEFARRPRNLIVAGCLSVAAVVTIVAFQSESDSVADADLTDDQLESDLLALGGLGVSDSANSGSGGVNPDFNFGEDSEPELPNYGNEAGFLNRSTVSGTTPDFGPSFDDAGPSFGRPIIITDPRSQPAIQTAGFQQPENSPSQIVGARVTANQAVWLTGSIETR